MHRVLSEDGVRRALENLAKNAVTYGDPEKTIEITVREIADSVVVTVHNEGSPIPHSEQEILFQQFRRPRPVGTKSGWGLGLIVVKGVTDAHHGSIQLKSEEGLGTTFSIELPKDWRIVSHEAAG